MQNPFARSDGSLSCLPTDLQLALKKYAKKDPNSRSKALEEISLVLKEPSSCSTDLFIPIFTQQFPKWASDPERKVREYCLEITDLLIQAEKAKMERVIVQILFPLMALLFDPVPSVSLVAKSFFEKRFQGKLSKLVSIGRSGLAEGFRKAISKSTTLSYEEINIYSEEERLFVQERRIGTAFCILNSIIKESPSEKIYGESFVDTPAQIICCIQDGGRFAKRCIFDCIHSNLSALDCERNNYSQQIFQEAIVQRERLSYSLALKYFDLWVAAEKMEIVTFLVDELEWFSDNLNAIAPLLSIHFRRHIIQQILQRKKLIPKHFFILIQIYSALEESSEDCSNWIAREFEKEPEFSTKTPDQLQSQSVAQQTIEAFKKTVQFRNQPLIINVILALIKFDRTAACKVLKETSLLASIKSLTFYLTVALEYSEQEEFEIDFYPFSLEERLKLAISKADKLSQCKKVLISLLPLESDLSVEQKLEVLFKFGIICEQWRQNEDLFTALLHSSNPGKKFLVKEFGDLAFLLDWAIQKYDSEGTLDDLITEVYVFLPLEFLALYAFVYPSENSIRLAPSFNKLQDLQSFQLHLKDLLTHSHVRGDKLFDSRILTQIDGEYFAILWKALQENKLIDQQFIKCAIYPSFLPIALDDICNSEASQRLLYQSEIKPSGQIAFTVDQSNEAKINFFCRSLCSFTQAKYSQATDQLLEWMIKGNLNLLPSDWKLCFLNILVKHPFLNVKYFAYQSLRDKEVDQDMISALQTFLQSATIDITTLLALDLAMKWEVPLNTNELLLRALFSFIEHSETIISKIVPGSIPSIDNSFSTLLHPNAYEWNKAELLIAVNVLSSLLQGSPALCRSLLSQPSQTPNLYSLISSTLSPMIIKQELEHATQPMPQQSSSKFVISDYSTSTQSSLLARYEIEDVTVELTIQFPAGYPLEAPKLNLLGGKRIGVTERQWRLWQLSTQTVLAAQNQRVLEALKLWRKNADKRFEGVEDCTICCSVFQPVDKTLPGQECRTCKQKFHSQCLFKWFASSGNSKCPLCRQFFK